MLHLKSRRWYFRIPSGGMLIEYDLFAGSRSVTRRVNIGLASCVFSLCVAAGYEFGRFAFIARSLVVSFD